jgi:excisionase family DNA binding protein
MTKVTLDTALGSTAAFSTPTERSFRVLDSRWDGRSTLSVEEAGDVLGLSRATAYAAANSGSLPVIRIGRRMVVPRHALERLLTSVSA